MKIGIRLVDKYAELVIREGGVTIESGLLDNKERTDLAIEFIDAAIDLFNGVNDAAHGLLVHTEEQLQLLANFKY